MVSLSFLWRRPLLAAVAAGALLLSIFFGLMLLTNTLGFAVLQFISIWPWVAVLVIGFSMQAYLYALLKNGHSASGARGGIAASGGMSAASMAACCAHHFTDVLPFLGFAAAATFLAQYQTLFLMAGVLSNLLGVIMMLGVFKKIKFRTKNALLKAVLRYDLDFAFRASAIAGIAIIAAFAAVRWLR